jgi:sortase A
VSNRPEGPRGIPSARPATPAWRRLRQHAGLRAVLLADDAALRASALRGRVTLHTVALGLIVLGLVTCLVPAGLVAYGMWQESQLTQSWDRSVSTRPSGDPPGPTAGAEQPTGAPAVPAASPPAASPPAASPPAFALRVPKIGYYAAVREGISMDLLATGPGHYPSTAMPGAPGLVAVAAHNTFWIPFGQLGPGDTVILETRSGRFTYRITGTRVVNPDDRTVLASTSRPSLVLTTCWPLWAGNLANQRLAIFAQQT